jgi:hypothetical protein
MIRDPISPGYLGRNNHTALSPILFGDNKDHKSSSTLNVKYGVEPNSLTRSNSIKSSYVGNLSVSKQEKVFLAMSKEDRELAKLQRIYEIE